MNRRAFTTKLFSIAAILALAPEIAFRRTLEIKQDLSMVYWTQSQCEFRYTSAAYEQWILNSLNCEEQTP